MAKRKFRAGSVEVSPGKIVGPRATKSQRKAAGNLSEFPAGSKEVGLRKIVGPRATKGQRKAATNKSALPGGSTEVGPRVVAGPSVKGKLRDILRNETTKKLEELQRRVVRALANQKK